MFSEGLIILFLETWFPFKTLRRTDPLNVEEGFSTCWRGWWCKLSEAERQRSSEGVPQVLPGFPVRRINNTVGGNILPHGQSTD